MREENNKREMDEVGSLNPLFVTIFLSQLAIFVITPTMPDVTMMVLCPCQDQCSLAIYLFGFQQAVCTFHITLFNYLDSPFTSTLKFVESPATTQSYMIYHVLPRPRT